MSKKPSNRPAYPQRIFLQIQDEEGNKWQGVHDRSYALEYVTWHHERIYPSDICYIRARGDAAKALAESEAAAASSIALLEQDVAKERANTVAMTGWRDDCLKVLRDILVKYRERLGHKMVERICIELNNVGG